MLKKLLPVIGINLLLIYLSDVPAYSNNIVQKVGVPKGLIEQVIEDNDPGTWLEGEYKGNISKLTKKITLKKQDLNGDGKSEYLILANSITLCGSGGCELWIYHKEADKYQALHPRGNDVVQLYDLNSDSIKVLSTFTNGYKDLECFVGSRVSYDGISKVILKFNGKRYERIE